MRTQVGIIGAGPAGLVLSHLLHLHGIESVVVENRSRQYVQERVRAGCSGTRHGGPAERNRASANVCSGKALVHYGVNLALRPAHASHRFRGPHGGKAVTIYAQHEVVKI